MRALLILSSTKKTYAFLHFRALANFIRIISSSFGAGFLSANRNVQMNAREVREDRQMRIHIATATII